MRPALPALLLLFSGLGFSASVACEQRFSADPPVFAPPLAGSGTGLDVLLATAADARAPVVQASHAVVVVRCPGGPGCPGEGAAGESGDTTYRVAFGDGGGAARSRGQALADIYKELRDRLSAKEHLDVRPWLRGDAGAVPALSLPRVDPKADDPLSLAAVRIMSAVDEAGSIAVDVVPTWAGAGCRISIQGGSPTAGAGCLLDEPPHEKGLGRSGPSF